MIRIIFSREFASYFATPLAYVFLVIYLVLSGAMAIYAGGFFERNSADLEAFFSFQPWLYLFLVPAIGMRLWSEERRSGTIELILTLPVSTGRLVAAKFMAAWAFLTLALALTLPFWLTVNFLGRPDNGAIAAGYFGCWLMGGAFMALSACLSALTRNSVIAFILGATASLLFLMSGLEMVQAFFEGWAPQILADTIASLSFLSHFRLLMRGVIELPTLFYFTSLIALLLFLNAAIIDSLKTR